MTTPSMTIDEILDLAGFQIFPAGANKNRLKAKTLIREVIEGVVPEKDDRAFPGIEPGQDPVRETCYQQGWNAAIDDMQARLSKVMGGENGG